MPWKSRMFWKVRATRALRAISWSGMRSSRKSSPFAVVAWRPLATGRGCDVLGVAMPSRAKREPPFGRLVEAGDAVEDGGFARAVRADERGDVAAPDREAESVDRDEAAEPHRQVFDREQRAGQPVHQPCPSLTRSPDTAFRSLRKIDGKRVETRPRGFQIIMMTIAAPNSSMRYCVGSKSCAEDRLHPVEFAHQFGNADHHRRGDGDAELRAHAAEHDDGENGRRFDEGEAFRADETLTHGEERAGKAAEHRAEREGGELGVGGVDAERPAGDLVLAQRFPRPPDRQPAEPQRDEIGEEREREDQIEKKDRAVDRRVGEMEDRGEAVVVVVEGNAEEA